MAKWTADEIPGRDGRTAVVTGANGGVGVRGDCAPRDESAAPRLWEVSEEETGVRFEFAGASASVAG